MKRDEQLIEFDLCFRDDGGLSYFINTYVKIEDPILGEWIPFDLWPTQVTTLNLLLSNRLVIILKARQLGLTWLVLAYFLWKMLFRPEIPRLCICWTTE